MKSLLHVRFWLPCLMLAGALILAPQIASSQPPLQSHAMAFLLFVTIAMSGYLFAVIANPEKF